MTRTSTELPSTDNLPKKGLSKLDPQTHRDETLLDTVTSCRWAVAYVGFVCFTVVYALRINMGIAMICMVKTLNATDSKHAGASECEADNGNGTSRTFLNGDIEWNKTIQGQVLSSYFYGYIFTQVLGGYLSGRYGGKRIMLIGLAVCGSCTVLIPFAARFDGKDYVTSSYLVITLRVLCGMSTGVVVPSMHNILGKWAPKYERSKLTVLTFSGMIAGNILMLGLGGFFCEWQAFDGGWPTIFYISGGSCLLFCVLWTAVIYDTPQEHPRITEMEKVYIMCNNEVTNATRNKYVPWLSIVKSPAVWAITVAHFCKNFGNYTLITKLPAFMKEVLKFDIKSNGLYSALPYIAMFLVANFASHVIDKLRETGRVSTVVARKIAMFLALAVPGLVLIATGHIPCGKAYLGVIGVTTAVAFTGFERSGYMVNPQDIASRYAGEVYGISNTFATIPGMVAPALVNSMTPNGTAGEWQSVFYVWASIYAVGAVFYLIFARGEIQPWATSPSSQSDSSSGYGSHENTESCAEKTF